MPNCHFGKTNTDVQALPGSFAFSVGPIRDHTSAAQGRILRQNDCLSDTLGKSIARFATLMELLDFLLVLSGTTLLQLRAESFAGIIAQATLWEKQPSTFAPT